MYALNKAAWTTVLATAVVIRMFPQLSSSQKNYYFSSCRYLCTQVVETCFVVSIVFFCGYGPRELPLYQQKKKYKNIRWDRNAQLFVKVYAALGS